MRKVSRFALFYDSEGKWEKSQTKSRRNGCSPFCLLFFKVFLFVILFYRCTFIGIFPMIIKETKILKKENFTMTD
ncbi:hypothetical protein COI44_16565 [Bacillus sp. AFS088145]|nr:hypothetical protein COI44_16565 [Bacillus sp. AFS088145]